MATVSNFLLMTGEKLPRRKLYRDWTDFVYVCDADHWALLTDEAWKVQKIALDASWDAEEIRNTDWYNNAVPNLAAVQSLTYK